jgi:hypothetical protein
MTNITFDENKLIYDVLFIRIIQYLFETTI